MLVAVRTLAETGEKGRQPDGPVLERKWVCACTLGAAGNDGSPGQGGGSGHNEGHDVGEVRSGYRGGGERVLFQEDVGQRPCKGICMAQASERNRHGGARSRDVDERPLRRDRGSNGAKGVDRGINPERDTGVRRNPGVAQEPDGMFSQHERARRQRVDAGIG